MQTQIVAGTAFVFIEYQSVGADVERLCHFADGFQCGLGLAQFVAFDLGDMQTHSIGERRLGMALGLAELEQARGEAHGIQVREEGSHSLSLRG